MASPSISFFFALLLISVSSLQIHAREKQFFSKVSPYNSNANTNINTVEKTEILPKESNSGNQNVEPSLIPETHNGYGLYGRDIDQGTQDTYIPEKTSTEGYNGADNSEFVFDNGNPYNRENNFGYENKQNSLYENKNYGSEKKQNNYNRYRYPVQQQGMSDTRFLENGRYFYDVNNEELYRNRYQYPTRRNDLFGSSSQEGMDENLYRFNNYVENNDNQQNKEEYLP